MKGIILAADTNSRMNPITKVVPQHLLPVYDTPMIYHSLATLMLARIRDIVISSSPHNLPALRRLLGSGAGLGLQLSYVEQISQTGLEEALTLGVDDAHRSPIALVLGSTILHGAPLPSILERAIDKVASRESGCVMFGQPVREAGQYTVGEIDIDGHVTSIREREAEPYLDCAIAGLLLCDNQLMEIVSRKTAAKRHDFQLPDISRTYMQHGRAHLMNLGRGVAWFDVATNDALIEAGEYVRVMQDRQGVRIACIEEVALRMGFIDAKQCLRLGLGQTGSDYGDYVVSVAQSMLDRAGESRLEG